MSRLLLWKRILLWLIVQYTSTAVSSYLDFLTGDGEASVPIFAPFEAGSNAKDLWNGGQSPEPFELSQINQCKDDFGQAPNQRRRVRRQKNGVCLPNYLNEPETVETHKDPTKLQKGSIEEQQDRSQQKTPGAQPSIEPDSPPILGETLVGPKPDSNICKDPARPIPVCHSGVDAVYSIILPWIADQLPNCHAISTTLGHCQAPDVTWCCAKIGTEPSPTFYFIERTIMVGSSCEVLSPRAG